MYGTYQIAEEKVKRLDSNSPHFVSAVTVSEFFAGVELRDGDGRKEARDFLRNASEIPLQGEISLKSGELLARKEKENLSLNISDVRIAATALVKDKKLLTSDTDDFGEIEELEIEDWRDY